MENTDEFVGFIPQKLNIEIKELSVFPLNILFQSFKNDENGNLIAGFAFYKPAIATYIKEKEIASLEYKNTYNEVAKVKIIYHLKKKSYEGEKYIGDKLVLSTTGADWKQFFMHLTMNGLSKGEPCFFEDVK